jgi:tripartite-type tricarboxylate transporter receptor subunit TctC
MLGGHVEATTHALSVLIPFATQGKARILLTSKKTKDFPNVPTLDELGYKQELFSPWFAMYAPVGVPEEVIRILVPAIKKAVDSPDVIAQISKIGGSVIDYKSPAELKKLAIEELKTISALAVELGLRK